MTTEDIGGQKHGSNRKIWYEQEKNHHDMEPPIETLLLLCLILVKSSTSYSQKIFSKEIAFFTLKIY